jgi:DNA polymerase I
MPTLYLIDGYAQFFRAYHAIRTPLTSPVTKEPTNMTFGFVGMLLKLLKGQEPGLRRAGRADYVAVALDVSDDRGTFRSTLYPDYKAHRPPPPEDLAPQVNRCLTMLKDLGVPIVGCAGFEADDVIATLVEQLRREHPDLSIRIVSKDKDLKQLLSDDAGGPEGPVAGVALFDVHNDTLFDAGSLWVDTGLKPAQVVDMLSLMGDAVDNVPGVDGVGEKTAATLIKEWGTLDNLLANADRVKGKRGENIRAAAPQLGLARQLVTLRRDVPVSLDLDRARTDRIDILRLVPILKELGFNRYQDEARVLAGEREVMPPQGQPGTAKEGRPSTDDGVAPAPGGLFAEAAARDLAASPRLAESGEYTCVRTREQLANLVDELRSAPIVSIDTETTSLSPHDAKLCGLCFAVTPGRGYYVPVRSPTPSEHLSEREVLAALRPILEDPRRVKCGHNLKYDLLVLRNAGVTLAGVGGGDGPPSPDGEGMPFDSMVASYLIDASRSSHSLDALALALLGRTNISISELIGRGKDQRTFDTVPLEAATQYAAEDADVALQLRAQMLPQVRAMGLLPLMSGVEMPLVEVLADLEWNGIRVDPFELDRQRAHLQGQIDKILTRLNAESRAAIGRTFDPDSTKQLAAVLFNKPDAEVPGLGIPGQKRTKTGYSTDAEVLEALSEDDSIKTPIPGLVLEYRQLSKLVSTYLVALRQAINPKTGRVHSSFHQTVAATGRLASSDPNLQNIPIRTDVGREIRRAFVAEPGHSLVTADYSQIELRLLAHLSRDPALIEAFQRDEDIHTAVAAQVHGIPPGQVTREQRSGAKMVNFGIVYGVTAFGLARRLKVPQDQAAAIIDGYKRRFAGITTFLQECIEQARRHGYVTTILGRRRPIPDIESKNPSRRSLAERLAINSVVQGSAADLIKVAMVNLRRRFLAGEGEALPGAVKMLLQIHDELVFEAPDAMAEPAKRIVVHGMENAMQLLVPLRADAHIAKDWYDGK